jgi:ankyrin repeat protein
MNALQVAIAAKQNAFVKELLNLKDIAAKQLEVENSNGDTALAITALSGNVEIAEKMVTIYEKMVTIDENLPMIRNRQLLPMKRNMQELLPLFIAAMHKQRDMVSYLYSVTEFDQLKSEERIKLLLYVISCDLYGMSYVSMIVSFRQLTR